MNNKLVASGKDFSFVINAHIQKMKEAGLPDVVIKQFTQMLEKVNGGDKGIISHVTDIEPVSSGKVVLSSDLSSYASTGQKTLGKTVMIKLNGGLGTGMGLNKAKSLLEVKPGLTFLDVIASQIESMSNSGIEMPLTFMNSFSTDDDTLAFMTSNHSDIAHPSVDGSFVQNKFPKVTPSSLAPITHSDESKHWNPPGHGDIYTALYASGTLQKMLDSGMEYAFISNSDNLGATINTSILGFMEDENVPFVMETALRTEADKKGGHLAQDRETGGLVLRERANTADNELAEFENIETWTDFNTNNIWINLKELASILEANEGVMPLDLIVNSKTANPSAKKDVATTEDKQPVIQIETAMGSAIRSFPGARAVRIDTNERFFPVKKVSDLLMLQSDAVLIEDGTIKLNGRTSKPVVLLDGRYKTTSDLNALIPNGAPSLKNANKLDVTGNVVFGKDIIVKGTVTIAGPTTDNSLPLVIEDGQVLENIDIN